MKLKNKELTLNTKLILVIVVSLIAAVALFFILCTLAIYFIKNVYLSDYEVKKRTEEKIDNFAEYVSENDIKSSDLDAIMEWQAEQSDIYILVYKNKKVIVDSSNWNENSLLGQLANKLYDDNGERYRIADSEYEKKRILNNIKEEREKNNSDATEESSGVGNATGDASDGENATEDMSDEEDTTEDIADTATEDSNDNLSEDSDENNDNLTASANYVFYSVKFSNGIYDVCIVDYSERRIYFYSVAGIFILCCFLFTMSILIYNRRVVNRVRRLTSEIAVIENTNIKAPITKSENDEITYLSGSIDNMRNTIITQLSKEKEAWQANRDLVTAMAHDIRTPLTVLSGYLDLLSNGDFESEEEKKQYLQICTERAEQLRDLSDKLFRYFYVYSNYSENLNLELFDAEELIMQIVNEYVILLEEKGIKFNVKESGNSAKILVDIQYFKRLFANIFTNIRKYADYDEPVEIEYEEIPEHVTLKIENKISKSRNETESTRIGIKTCEKIAQELNFKFRAEENDGTYTVFLDFTEKM